MNLKGQKKRGTILLTVLGFMVVVLILLVTGTGHMRIQSQANSGSELRTRARYAAEAGMQMALQELTENDEWGSKTPPEVYYLDVSEDGSVQAKLEVWGNSSGSSSIFADDGTAIPPGKAYIVSTGVVLGREFGGALGSARSIVARPVPELNYALHDRGWVSRKKVGDAWIDGYDSSVESPTDPSIYNWQTGQPNQPSLSPPHDGRAVAKIRSESFVEVQSPVYGDIYLPTGEPVTAPSHYGNVHYDDNSPPEVKFVAPKALRESALLSPSYSDMTPGRYGIVQVPANTTVTFRRGAYLFRELHLGDGAVMQLADNPAEPEKPSVLYIEDMFETGKDVLVNMTFSGAEPQARQMQIFGTDRVEQVSYNGLGNTVGTIFEIKNGSRVRACMGSHKAWFRYGVPTGLSPQSGTGSEASGRMGVDLFGAVMGVQIADVEGVRYHYDSALENQVLEGQTQWALESTAKK